MTQADSKKQKSDSTTAEKTASCQQTDVLKRYIYFGCGLFVMAFGVAFSIRGNLGTSPISSFPYVLSLLTPLTVGTATICMHCVLILIQILILRKKYRPVQLVQLPVAFAFGYLTDFALWVLRDVTYTAYWQQWILCIIGIILVGFGVSMEFTANVVVLAGEGVVLAVCQVKPIRVSNMKIAFDVTLVASAVVVSVIGLHHLAGVREGTVAAAILVGTFTKKFNKIQKKFTENVLGWI